MKKVVIPFLVLALTGCSFGKEPVAPPQVVKEPGRDLSLPRDAWIIEHDSNGSLAELTMTRMTPAERERVRGEVSRNNVTWINSKGGYSLYKFTGSERFEKNAFILPKVLVIGSVDGGRASLRDLPGGKVALTIPIALVDGSQRELPYSTSRIRIPDALYLDDAKRAAIQKELIDTFGYEHELSNLGSCPQKIVIKIAGVENDVTPKVFAGPSGPTGCQVNQPFTVTIQGSRRYIERFLSEDVFNGSAEISVMYQVAGTFVDEIRLYLLKTGTIYSKLKSRLFSKTDSGEVRQLINSDGADRILGPYVQEALEKWASREPFLDRVKSSAIAQLKLALFDEKWIDKSTRAFMLKEDSSFNPVDVPVRVLGESLGRQGEIFYSSSIIKPVLNSTNIAIRGEERPDLKRPPGQGVAQDVFTVREGEEYELQLTSLVIHEYEFGDEQAQPKIEDKGLVCLDRPGQTFSACRKYKNECTEYKSFCKLSKTGCTRFGTKSECNTEHHLSVTGCLTLGIFGGCSIERKCEQVPDTGTCLEFGPIGCEEWGNYCSQTQQTCEPGQEEPLCRNQISDLRISRYFSASAPVNSHLINAPLGNSDQDVVGGLTLRFRWPDGKSIDCLALALLTEVSGQSIRFKVKNNAYCTPFPEGYKGQPVLSIVNKVSTERRDIPCGIMNFSTVEGTKYYGCNGYNAVASTPDLYRPGEMVNASGYSRSPLYLTYYPVVDVNGVLISRSGAMTSGSTTEEKWED